MKGRKWIALALSAALCIVPFQTGEKTGSLSIATVSAEDRNDMPSDYATACDWIWTNRIEREGSMKDWATIYDQIVAGNGTLQYILIWQSYEKITLEQRQKLPQMLEDAVNQWTDHLIGYDGWPFQHVNVKIVGYAVLDKSCLLDLQPDEVVYTDTTSSWLRDDMITSGMGDTSVPAIQPAEPTDLSRYSHWSDPNWSYHGSYSNRYDMYLHGITGMIHMGGYGYHYGQILSDQSVLGLIDGTTSQHILLHEMGHGFGFPDYYGGEGESDGFPPGGFPGGENSIMMAGSCSSINQFDQWFLKYAWSKLKAENGRFDLSAITTTTTVPTTTTTSTTTTTTTSTTTITTEPISSPEVAAFTDTISEITQTEDGGIIRFANNGTFLFHGTDYFGGDAQKNLLHYEAGDKIQIRFTYEPDTSNILYIESLSLEQNAHTVQGDVDANGVFALTDVVLMQKWLLAVPDTNLANWEAGDFCKDGNLNGYDLFLMKYNLFHQ